MLSKTRYTYGLQCHLRLYNHHHRPELAPAVSEATQHIFDFGHRVGELATHRWPGGLEIEAPHRDPDRAVAQTAAALDDPTITAVYEASFRHRGVFIAVDVLARLPAGGWQLVEVKSTSRVKEQHLHDAAIQLWVLRGAGVDVRQAGVLTLNTAYVYEGGDYDLQQLFTLHDVSDDIERLQSGIDHNVIDMTATLRADGPPMIAMGRQCKKPYECPFMAACSQTADLPERPVTLLPGVGPETAEKWADQGVVELSDIPGGWPLTLRQRHALSAALTGRPWVSDRLGSALQQPHHPIHHLDFETVMPGLPRWPGTRPFEQQPTQFSDHIERADGTVDHIEYIHRGRGNPLRSVAEALLFALGEDEGSIVIYTSFEKTQIRQMARACPDLAPQLLALLDRCWDLKQVIDQHLYHPAFAGSYSLKAVVPALLPERDYAALTISDGLAAVRAYEAALAMPDGYEREAVFTQLLAYCEMDTLVMVELRQKLAEMAAASDSSSTDV